MPRRSGLVTRPADELLGEHPGYGFAGFSVSTAIGNFTHYAIDLGFPAALLGLLDYARSYNSLGGTGNPLGQGWASSFSAQLSATEEVLLHHTPGPVRLHDDDGRVLTFTPCPDGGYERPQDLAADLTWHDDGFTLDLYDTGTAWQFDQNGRHTGCSQEGHTASFDYDGEGRLPRATPLVSSSRSAAASHTPGAARPADWIRYPRRCGEWPDEAAISFTTAP